jgi:hypothetical protein
VPALAARVDPVWLAVTDGVLSADARQRGSARAVHVDKVPDPRVVGRDEAALDVEREAVGPTSSGGGGPSHQQRWRRRMGRWLYGGDGVARNGIRGRGGRYLSKRGRGNTESSLKRRGGGGMCCLGFGSRRVTIVTDGRTREGSGAVSSRGPWLQERK